MCDYKKTFFLMLSILVIPVLVYGLGMFLYDPLQIYHKPLFREPTLHNNMREQALGIMKNYAFDSVIMGNSRNENTSAREAGQVFGGKFFNLSISGSTLYERKILLNYLLDHKDIKTVVMQLDVEFLIYSDLAPTYYSTDSYAFLYDANPFNDFQIYMNQKYTNCLLSLSKANRCVGYPKNWDAPNAWENEPTEISRFGGLHKWVEHREHVQLKERIATYIPATATAIAAARQQPRGVDTTFVNLELISGQAFLDRNLFTLCQAYPNTRFVLIVSPFYKFLDAEMYWLKPNNWAIREGMLRYLLAQADKYPNLEVYGFENVGFATDIARFKDMDHYDSKGNSYLLQASGQGQHRLTSKNLEAYLVETAEQARDFAVEDVYTELQALQQKKP